jgi:hypothetical protein
MTGALQQRKGSVEIRWAARYMLDGLRDHVEYGTGWCEDVLVVSHSYSRLPYTCSGCKHKLEDSEPSHGTYQKGMYNLPGLSCYVCTLAEADYPMIN